MPHLYSEEDVRQKVVAPALAALGYVDCHEVNVRYELNLGGMRADVVVYVRGFAAIVIECKNPRIPLRGEHRGQVLTYAYTLEAPYAALCNGIDWEFYHAPTHTMIHKLPPFHAMDQELKTLEARIRQRKLVSSVVSITTVILLVCLALWILAAARKYVPGFPAFSVTPSKRTSPPRVVAGAGASESAVDVAAALPAAEEQVVPASVASSELYIAGTYQRASDPKVTLVVSKSFEVGEVYRVRLIDASGQGDAEMSVKGARKGEAITVSDQIADISRELRLEFFEGGVTVTEIYGDDRPIDELRFAGEYRKLP